MKINTFILLNQKNNKIKNYYILLHMYNSVVTDKDSCDFVVPKTRLEKILNCFNTRISTGSNRTIRKQYLNYYNKLLYAVEKIGYLKVVMELLTVYVVL